MSVNWAVVTGGYSGIGAATVRKLLDQGHRVAIMGRNADKFEAFRSTLPDAWQQQVAFAEADVAQSAQIEQAMREIRANCGPIRYLVNCAGWNRRNAATEVDPLEWERVIDTNLKGTFYCSGEAAKWMIQDKIAGSIVNVGSMLSHYGVPNVAVYGAAKGGVSMLTRTLSVEWAEHGIRVNQVSPGYIATPFVDLSLPENRDYRNRLVRRTPLGRLGTPEEVSNVIAFLLSEEASYVTGQIIGVDGGILGGDPTLNPLKNIQAISGEE